MSEEIPEKPPATPGRHEAAEPASNGAEELPREHDDDRSPADPHDWQDEWDRARWAP